MKTTHESPVAQRIRKIRREKGWSLKECQIRSRGRLQAVTLGSYERGERSISLARLALIAEVFEVSIEYLLVARDLTSNEANKRHIYDLHALSRATATREKELLLSYIAEIIKVRGDWQGAVISLRASDLSNLQILFASQFKASDRSYIEWVESQNFLMKLESNA